MPIAKLRSFVRALAGRRNVERDVSEEMQFHIERRSHDLISQDGLSEAQARRQAKIEFGSIEKYKEEGRQSLGLRMVDEVAGDVRYAVRQLRRSPGFAFVAILTMALAIGVNTTIFSVVDAVLFRPLPYPAPDRLVTLSRRTLQGEAPAALNARTYEYWAANNQVFESVAAVTGGGSFVVADDEGAQHVTAIQVTSGFFETIGVQPNVGRGFLPDEDLPGASPVVILSHSAWEAYFGAAADLIGETVRLSNEPFTVVGILPEGFSYTNVASAVYLPLVLATHPARGGTNYTPLGRLNPSLSLEAAQAETELIYRQFVTANPEYEREDILGLSAMSFLERVTFNVRPVLVALLAAVGTILLIACMNLANLLLARMTVRLREISIRTAIGAHTSRILRQLFVEGLVFSAIAGTAGVLLSFWGVDALVNLGTGLGARAANASVDGRVLLFALAVTVVTAVVFGASGVLHARRTKARDALKAGGTKGGSTGRRRLVSTFVVLETALSVVLLIGASLLITTVYRLQTIPFGFDTENLVSAELVMSAEQYLDPAAQAEFERQLRQQVRTIPGVVSAATASGTPLVNTLNHVAVIEGAADPQRIYIEFRSVSPEYFATVGIPVLRGRSFTESDTSASEPVVIVNEAFAARFSENVNPMGQRVILGPGFPQRDVPRSVVGIVQNVLDVPPGEQGVSTVYVPRSQQNAGFNEYINTRFNPSVVMRTQGNAGLSDAFRAVVSEIDPLIPVRRIRTMDQIVSDSTAGQRFNMLLMSVFAASALILTIVGLYGVLSYQVSQRTPEIGVRMALGATRSDALRSVLKRGATLAIAGSGIGLAAAYGFTRLLSNMLYGVEPIDIEVFASVGAITVLVSLAASYLPARRAAHVDPMVALRYE